MPINNIPFTQFANAVCSHPVLLVKIINPESTKHIFTFGIIDTGADECAVPAVLASKIGHNLKKGEKKEIHTAGGITKVYSHKTKFELYHPETGKFLYTISKTPIDYCNGLQCVLLGVKNFLDRFVLHIDYPHKNFSIKHPKR